MLTVHTRAHVDAFRPPEQLTEQFMMRTRSHRQTCHAMLDPFKNGIPNNYQGLACALYIHTCTFRYSPAEHLIRPCESRASWGVWQWAILPPPSIRQLAAARKNSRSSLCRWSIFLVEAAVLAVSNQFQLSPQNINGVSLPLERFFYPSSQVSVTEPPPLVGRRRHGPASRGPLGLTVLDTKHKMRRICMCRHMEYMLYCNALHMQQFHFPQTCMAGDQ
ncbi:hypothetical protein J3E68DRAFT_391602 [Trichoderma sp. SZMC 28012]